MDILFSIASGLGLRVLFTNLPEPTQKFVPPIVGLWEGITSYFIISQNFESPVTDLYLAYALRLVVDFMLSYDLLRVATIILWSTLGVLSCRTLIFSPDDAKRLSSRRSRKNQVVRSTSHPSRNSVYESRPRSIEPVLKNKPAPEIPLPDQPTTPPSFFLQGGDSDALTFSPAPIPLPPPAARSPPPARPPSALAPLLDAASDDDLPMLNPELLPTPPASSFSAEVEKNNVTPGRLPTITEESSLPTAEYSESPLPTPAPLPVPDPFVRQPAQFPSFLQGPYHLVPGATMSPQSPPIVANVAPPEFPSRLSTPDNAGSDPLQTPLPPFVRAALDEETDADNEDDELQTPLTLSKRSVTEQLSPLLLPVHVSSIDNLKESAQNGGGRRRDAESDEAGQNLHQGGDRERQELQSSSIPQSPTSESGLSMLSTVVPKKLYSRGDDWRNQARDAEKRRDGLKEAYRIAMIKRKVTDAFMLKGQIEEAEEEIKRLHKKAARRYYMSRNMSHSSQTVDVHGLRPQEAIEVTEKAFREALASGHGTLKVITGKGLHSKNNIPVLRNNLIKSMEEQRIPCEIDPNNSGVLILRLPPPHQIS